MEELYGRDYADMLAAPRLAGPRRRRRRARRRQPRHPPPPRPRRPRPRRRLDRHRLREGRALPPPARAVGRPGALRRLPRAATSTPSPSSRCTTDRFLAYLKADCSDPRGRSTTSSSTPGSTAPACRPTCRRSTPIRFAKVDAAAPRLPRTAPPPRAWTPAAGPTHEWLHFLRNLPRDPHRRADGRARRRLPLHRQRQRRDPGRLARCAPSAPATAPPTPPSSASSSASAAASSSSRSTAPSPSSRRTRPGRETSTGAPAPAITRWRKGRSTASSASRRAPAHGASAVRSPPPAAA